MIENLRYEIEDNMSHKWKKLGLLYCPTESGRHPKLLTHVANPLPIRIKGDVYRIFFCGRDSNNRSSIGAVDIDIVKRQVVQEYSNTFFEYGPRDSFYADGLSIGNCYEVNGVQYMLFMGWQTHEHGHWHGYIGRLAVKEDLTLELDSKDPFIGIHKIDPFSLSYPWVLKTETGKYKMWYGSTITWDTGDGEMLHVINHAFSTDGHNWTREGLAVPYECGKAQAFSRPTVVKNCETGHDMWFSYRSGTGERYRIGYAYSPDGETWQLALDRAGIDVSPHGWDSEMIEYPFVFDHASLRYMLYNGNGYGKTGFGLAIREQN
ncbi:MAG: hypothetical protein ACRESZ_18610 [Methylococcales bacterium]